MGAEGIGNQDAMVRGGGMRTAERRRLHSIGARFATPGTAVGVGALDLLVLGAGLFLPRSSNHSTFQPMQPASSRSSRSRASARSSPTDVRTSPWAGSCWP